ncbi:hypothetical protein BHAOGJBA_4435 [Methylobacterium hispanicum]|uniref:Uncharacterized protein n=1 Tax=Methylobacterium hispanicum TaxID=270350 RepID=A0AAV4ZQP3_9HYPH|nr:hypothetical protein [Methylobacterium hispanicum]GJD90891.1 hypothetical protein BHAOGJBA_4435 [Methylobacterium hispanicum]
MGRAPAPLAGAASNLLKQGRSESKDGENNTLHQLAEEFHGANADICDGLAAELKAAGADQHALDDIVHDGAENDGRDVDEASDVDNQGFSLQAASILEGNGIEEGTRLVRSAMPAAAPRA